MRASDRGRGGFSQNSRWRTLPMASSNWVRSGNVSTMRTI